MSFDLAISGLRSDDTTKRVRKTVASMAAHSRTTPRALRKALVWVDSEDRSVNAGVKKKGWLSFYSQGSIIYTLQAFDPASEVCFQRLQVQKTVRINKATGP